MSTPLPTEVSWSLMAQTLASINVSLKTIADYVTLLHTEKTGEKIYEVQRYVVGTDGEGQPCVWLYSTHPGLDKAVTRVYHDHLHKLPYPVDPAAKVFDGEQAPSAEAAAKKGYFCAFPAPFSISLIPTGKTTDAGHPVRRLNRVLDAPKPPAADPAAGKPANGNGKQQQPRPIMPPEPPSWEEFEEEWEQMPPAAAQPAQAAALTKAEEERAAKAAFEARMAARASEQPAPAKPLSVDHDILAAIAQRETVKANSGFAGPATPEQWGLLKGLLEKAMGDKDGRNTVLARLCGVETKTVENPDWRAPKARAAAIIDWLVAKQPDGVTAVRPYTVADGRGADLATVLQGAWGTLASAPTEDVPY